MKFLPVFISLTILSLLVGCSKPKDNFLQEKNKNKIIALQPLDDYNIEQLNFIRAEISSRYKRVVIILKPVKIPPTFRLAPGADIYSADSLLNMLSAILNKEIIEVVGLTNKNIYIFKKNTDPAAINLRGHNVSPVFGFGDYPGQCSVVSDYLFKSDDQVIFNHRLRTVIVHEIGHNLDLDHCTLNRCIMSEENSKIYLLDKSDNDYCDLCKRKLDY